MLGWILGFGLGLQSSTSLLGADVFGTQAVTIPSPGMIFFYSF